MITKKHTNAVGITDSVVNVISKPSNNENNYKNLLKNEI